MKPIKDDERLSALLEGRVRGPERDALLAHLSASGDDYEVYADTARVLRALEEEDAQAAAAASGGVIPIARARGWRTPGVRWLMAAAVAGIVLTTALVWRQRESGAADLVQLAAAADPAGDGLPPGWMDTPPWVGVRGDGSPGAAQAGALMTQLAVAVRARDAADVQHLANQVRNSFDPGAGPETPLGRIAARPNAPPASLEPLLARAMDRLADAVDRQYLRLGAWAEAARLAAHDGDAAFFRTPASQEMLQRAERLSGDDRKAGAAAGRVRAALEAEGAPEWAPVRTDLDALLSEIAS